LGAKSFDHGWGHQRGFFPERGEKRRSELKGEAKTRIGGAVSEEKNKSDEKRKNYWETSHEL